MKKSLIIAGIMLLSSLTYAKGRENSIGSIAYKNELAYYASQNTDGSISFSEDIISAHIIVKDIKIDRTDIPFDAICDDDMCYRALIYIERVRRLCLRV